MSFIGEIVRRHPLHSLRWPEEDLLTEVTAALLRQVPDLAVSIAAWLGSMEALPSTVLIDTQVATGGKRRVDLEMLVPGELRIWVEIKNWSEEGWNQLPNYEADIQKHDSAEPIKLIFLNRLGGRAPSTAIGLRWQEFGDQVAEWAKARRDQIDGWSGGLIRDYLDYLKEEGLSSSAPLDRDLPATVLRFRAARNALDRLHHMTHDLVRARGWEPRPDGWAQRRGGLATSRWPDEWWSVYRARPPIAYGGACDFQWALDVEADAGQAIFRAGLIYRQEWEGPDPTRNRSWLERLTELEAPDPGGRFHRHPAHDYMVVRDLSLDRLRGDTLADQAGCLAEFAHCAFEALEQNPPE